MDLSTHDDVSDRGYCTSRCTDAYVVNFNVSSTKDNAHAKLSRYV